MKRESYDDYRIDQRRDTQPATPARLPLAFVITGLMLALFLEALDRTILGTAVTSAVSGDLMSHLPANQADRLALMGALQHSFLAVLIFALIALAATFFLQEAPIVATQGVPSLKSVAQVDEESDQELIYA
jgi:hypothetical protein